MIHTGVGGITENDVNLASASTALVVGFNVRPSAEARLLADREGVDIRTYRVIYQLTEDIQQALVGMLSPVETEETIGEAEVRALFKVSRLGTIAGCMVTNGVVRRNAQVRLVRDGTVIVETADRAAQALQGRRAGGSRGLRVRHPARRLQRRQGRRRPRGLRDVARWSAPISRAGRACRLRVGPAPPAAGRTHAGDGHRLRRHPLVRALLSREPLAQGEADARALGEGASPATDSAARSPRSTTTTSGSGRGSRSPA